MRRLESDMDSVVHPIGGNYFILQHTNALHIIYRGTSNGGRVYRFVSRR